MTQVIGLLTEEYVFQVSDRRFTGPDGEVSDDDRNKAVGFARQSIWAYTGFGRLPGPANPAAPTDRWLADHFYGADPDFGQMLLSLARSASSAVDELPDVVGPRAERLHAFVGVGFVDFRADPDSSSSDLPVGLRPTILCVSNYLKADNEREPTAHEHFMGSVCPLPEGSSLCIHVAGQPLPDGIEPTLLDALQETGGDPLEIVRRLVTGIRITAQHNPYVGGNLMVSVLPRVVSETPGAMVSIPAPGINGIDLDSVTLDPDAPTFLYLSVDGKAYAFGPWASAPGSMQIGEVQVAVRDDDEWPEWSPSRL